MSFDLSSLASKISPWWLKVLPYVIAILMAGLLLASYTRNVKQEATAAADKKWEKRIEEFDAFARQRVSNIYDASAVLATNANSASARQLKETQKAISSIQLNAEAGRYLVVENGRCVFTPEYMAAFETIRNTLPRKP